MAKNNPWEFLHKLRFGHPASPMPPFEVLGLTAQDAADVGLYVQTTLP